MHRLDAPTPRDELGRQPVEQLGVARRRPGLAEVVGRGNDPLAKVEQPDPVDHHARGQRMAGLSQPLRKCQPAAAGTRVLSRGRPGERLRGGECPDHSRPDFAAGLSVLAPLENRRLHVTRQVVKGTDLGECSFRGLLGGDRRGDAGSLGLVVGVSRAQQCGQPFLRRTEIGRETWTRGISGPRFAWRPRPRAPAACRRGSARGAWPDDRRTAARRRSS